MFGGDGDSYKQISVVDNCKLKRNGTLPFNSNSGACAQRDNAEIFICFADDADDTKAHKTCHRADGPFETFSKLPKSKYRHRGTRIAVTSGKLNYVK